MEALNVVVAPLDWGLGHASRCVPIIRYLHRQGHNVQIISGKGNYTFLKKEFPNLEHTIIPSFDLNLPKKNVGLSLITQSGKIAKGIKKEAEIFEDWLTIHPTDLIISDNRYGIYSKEIPSVIVSHQLKVKVPFGWSRLPQKKIDSYLDRFKEIWIPDEVGNTYSGELSANSNRENIRFLGLLSRFNPSNHSINKYDIIGLVSGPETQRTLFQNELFDWMKDTDKKCLLLCGLPDKDFDYEDENVRVISHLETNDLEDLILKSDIVISRSGYSTIMDLLRLKKPAILVPTPGQSEQLYLAEYLAENKIFKNVRQGSFAEDINLESLFELGHVNIEKDRLHKEMDDFIKENF